MSSADCCGAVREDVSALSPTPGHPAELARSAVIPSVHWRPIDQAPSVCKWGTSRSRARSSQLYHTSYRVHVIRPARSFHAAFRPHLAVTPWRFPCSPAPRTPGQETFTPEHDSLHGTHARGELLVKGASFLPVSSNALIDAEAPPAQRFPRSCGRLRHQWLLFQELEAHNASMVEEYTQRILL
jgi:hypothetical protein